MLEVVGYLSNIGLNLKALGVKANSMGCCVISSVGGFGMQSAYAPLCRKLCNKIYDCFAMILIFLKI